MLVYSLCCRDRQSGMHAEEGEGGGGGGGRRRGSLGKLGHVSTFVSLPLCMADYTLPSRPCSKAGVPEEQCLARGTVAHLR